MFLITEHLPVLLTLVSCSQVLGFVPNISYKAGVVEFAPTIGNVSSNTKRFTELIRKASRLGCDIIVFPEIGLNGYGECSEDMLTEIPHPLTKTAPYLDGSEIYSTALKRLSQAANESQIYLVVNLAEVVPCQNETGCPSNGRFRYNTNVAFDRNGVVIARYRKFNLFGEPDTNVTRDAEISFFDTDFGVRFGMFICFDLMFDTPTNQLVRQLGIRDFVFSTAWFSELPFLTAVQAQNMWSYSQDVNFLGSGYNMPSVGSGGSGIFRGRDGAMAMISPNLTTTELLVADLPILQFTNGSIDEKRHVKIETPSNIPPKETMFLKKENMTAYVTKSITTFNSTTVCHGDFCCDFSVKFRNWGAFGTYFRAVVFDGVRTFDGIRTGGIQTCAIVYCLYDTIDGCGEVGFPDNGFELNEINITGTFDTRNALPMPSTVVGHNQLQPLSSNTFSFDEKCSGKSCKITMQLKHSIMNVKTFGIYSRNFLRDGEPVTLGKNYSAKHLPNSMFYFITFIILIASKNMIA